ncbi:MAG: L,D-transpeptidase family protein [Caldimicrobium sp.]
MKPHKLASYLGIFLFYIILLYSQALAFTLLKKDKFIYFQDEFYTIKDNDTLTDLAVKFKVGYEALLLANPGVDPWVPTPGTKIIIPKKILLPSDFILNKKTYILINLPEMRLYYFDRGNFMTFPIGIGDEGRLPPLGGYYIARKKEKPFWFPPPSIRAEDPDLPEIVPPGPDNPMGEYALYLDRGLYAIHGTNKPYSIGRRTTHGCIRLYPEDIKFLYNQVSLKTPVYVIYEPYKVALEGNYLYLQAFPDIEKRIKNPFPYIIKKIEKLIPEGFTYRIDLLAVDKILENPDGLVHKIGILKKLE